ncbi:MAG: GntR family transcriptional regulator [Lachnospiraceae bacterium]|nr:GntR family transcriptional regulator [Candidatus Equihabitans merdae]
MNKTDYKYASVYNHFKKMIEEGALEQGNRLPSLLKCSKTLSVSKTTVENAYFMLSADVYIISRE